MYAPNLTRLANEQLAQSIALSSAPERFRGFCVLPIGVRDEATRQLEVCVREHKFAGALVDRYAFSYPWWAVRIL